ncbi:MAG: Ig-like domain-containing protein, partial [Gammaproteobacteria bacterium]
LEGEQAAVQLAVTQAVLIAIELSHNSIVLPNGVESTIQAIGHYSNNSTQDITNIADWSIANTSVASVTIADTTATIRGLAAGDTSLSVGLQGITASIDLTITSATLEEIILEPVASLIAVGNTANLIAWGRFSDGEVRIITEQVAWQSSDEAIVAAGNGNYPGEVHGLGVGVATITAALNNIAASTNVTVSNAALTGITITPAFISLAKGTFTQLTATGLFTDNSTRDITQSVTWIVDDSLLANIENSQQHAGLLRAIAVGETTVSAFLDGVSAELSLTVTDAKLVSINVTPSQPAVAASTQLQFSAFANFSDGSIQDISDFVAWSSQDSDVAVIHSQGGKPGNVLTLSAGTSNITASLAGITGSTKLTVSAATLTAITIDQANLSLAKGTSARLLVTAHFSDATTQDFTPVANFVSSQPEYVSVDNSENNKGSVHALQSGASTITASITGDAVPAVAIDVIVTDAVLETISITPQNSSIPNNSTLQFNAVGHFSDNSTQDITEQVTWNTLDPEVAVVSNVAGDTGLVSGVVGALSVAGETEVSAEYYNGNNLITAATRLNVSYEPQRPVFVVPLAQPNVILNDGSDSTTLQTFVKASENGAVVANGTIIEYEIVSGSGVLSSQSAATVDGIASVLLTSNSEGFIVVQATVQITQVSNFVVILSTASFANVISRFAIAKYDYDADSNLVQPGSIFTLYIFNFGSRNFSLDQYEFINGGITLKTIDQFDVVNNQLNGGGIYGLELNVIPELVNNGIQAQFTLSDTATGQIFTVSHTYDLQP